jgi:hypothetical protein
MNILFIIPDGVGIRNYLYSDLITHLKEKARLAFWSPLPKEAFDKVLSIHNIKVDYEQISLLREPFIARLFREAATYARLHYNAKKVNNETILKNWNKINPSLRLRFLYSLAEKLGGKSSRNYDEILKLEKLGENGWSRKIIDSYKQKLTLLKPSVIFITHQRVAGLMPICIAAQELGIKVISAIYSWDNLPKARLAVKADQYIVWSERMQLEMENFYPHLKKNQIKVCGTPQFDFYFQKQRLVNRIDFAKKYDLDESKQWICFSGNDTLTCPYDAEYLADVVEGLKQIPITDRPQLIFRRSPADFSDRYDGVINSNRDLIKVLDPIWFNNKGNNWGANFAKPEDVDLLVNLAHHCGLVINIGSTMAHDFAIYNKPCIYIRFDQPNAQNWSVHVTYRFEHFKSMDGINAVGFITQKEDFASKILTALKNPDEVGPDRKVWLQRIIQHPIENSSKLIANVILENNEQL